MDDSQYATIEDIKSFSPALKRKILQVEGTEANKKAPPLPSPASSSGIQLEFLHEDPPPLPPLPPPNHHRHYSLKHSSPPLQPRAAKSTTSAATPPATTPATPPAAGPMQKARSLDIQTVNVEGGEPSLESVRPKAGECKYHPSADQLAS